jgi:hypothetical protein
LSRNQQQRSTGSPSRILDTYSVHSNEDRGDQDPRSRDYHLGQVLNAGSNFVILDFEGEPRKLASGARRSPLSTLQGAAIL